MKNYWTLILFFLFFHFSYSQEEIWTLEKCINYALDKNIEVKQGRLQKEVSEAQLILNKQAFLPDINFSGDHVYYFGRSIDPTTNSFNNTTTQTNSFGLSSTYELFNGLENFHSLKRNKLELQSIALEQEDLKSNLELNIAVAYLNILQFQEQLNQANIQKKNLFKQKEMVDVMIESGISPGADIIEIESSIINQSEVIESFNLQLNTAIASLKNILMLPFEEQFNIETRIERDIDTSFLNLNISEIKQNAINWHPSIKSFFYKNQITDLEVKIAKSNYLPKVSLFGGATTKYSNRFVNLDGTYTINPIGYALDDPFNIIVAPSPNFSKVAFGNQLANNISYVLGLRLTVPIYNKGEIKNAVRVQEINKKQVQFNYESTLRKLEFDIEQKTIEAISAFNQYKIALKSVSNNASSFVVASEKYNAGIINIYEWINAQNNFFIAESKVVQHKYRYIFNQLIIDFYNGEALKI